MNLRPYQTQAIEAVEAAFDSGTDRVLITLPTGTGKTVTFAHLIERRRQIGCAPALVLAHRGELLEQARDKLLAVAPALRVGIEQADQRAHPDCDVVCASVQTLSRPGRMEGWQPRLIIVDEAHHAAADGKTYARILERMGAMEGWCQVLGVTATPKRLDRKALTQEAGALFEAVAFNYPLIDAIRDGYLCPLKGYRVRTDVDMTGIHTSAGDYNQAELAEAIDDEERTEAVIEQWETVARDRQTLVFALNVQHAHHVAWAWEAAGYRAEVVHGAMSAEEREGVRKRFEAGETQVVANCQLWTEGVDIPSIDCVVLMRPTQSWSLYVQMVGRGTRLHPGKAECVVIDVVDNVGAHSLTTLPAILDLPYDLDLEGATLEEAHKVLEELGERAGELTIKAPKTLRAVRALLEEVDMLAGAATPPEILAITDLIWLRVRDRYVLSLKDKRRCEVSAMSDGGWNWEMFDTDGKCVERGFEVELGEAIRTTEDRAELRWPTSTQYAHPAAPFRKLAPSEKQLDQLRKWGVSEGILAAIDKGIASSMITERIERSRSRRKVVASSYVQAAQ